MNVFFTVNINCDPNHEDFMSQNTRDSFKNACDRWNCEYVEWTEPFKYHPAIAKLYTFDLLKSLDIYPDKVFVIDSDTIIRYDTPSPFKIFDSNGFYAVKNQQDHYPPSYKQPNVEAALQNINLVIEKKNIDLRFLYHDPNYISKNFFNSGVMLFNYGHREVLEYAQKLVDGIPGLSWWDQIPLNISTNYHTNGYIDMGKDWNYQFPIDFNSMSTYIYHLAGNPERYELLKYINWKD